MYGAKMMRYVDYSMNVVLASTAILQSIINVKIQNTTKW